MKYRLLALAALCVMAVLAACSGSTGPTPPLTLGSNPPLTLSYAVKTTAQFTVVAPAIGGNQAAIVFPQATSGPTAAGITITATNQLPGGVSPLSAAMMPQAFRQTADYGYAGEWFYQVVPTAALGFSAPPGWKVTIGSPIPGAAYFISYYDPTVPGWNVGFENGAPAATPSPNATNVAYLFTPQPLASPFALSTSGATFALVAISGATPTPAPTPTFNLGDITSLPNLIQDPTFSVEGAAGGFSSNSSGWTPCANPVETPTPGATLAPEPTIQSAVTYNGDAYAALTGATLGGAVGPHEPEGAQGICQTVTVPPNPAIVMWVQEGANDGSAYVRQEAAIISGTTETPLFQDYTCTGNATTGQKYNNCDPGTTSPIAWAQRGPYTSVLAPYVGQKVTLFIGVWAKEYSSSVNYGVYMYVDNVYLVSVP